MLCPIYNSKCKDNENESIAYWESQYQNKNNRVVVTNTEEYDAVQQNIMKRVFHIKNNANETEELRRVEHFQIEIWVDD